MKLCMQFFRSVIRKVARLQRLLNAINLRTRLSAYGTCLTDNTSVVWISRICAQIV